MVFTALSLVAMVFFGTMFDDFARSLLSLIFAVVFLLVFEHFISRGWNHFLVLSIASMVPYAFWMVLDQWDPPQDRYDIFQLLKILPFAAVFTIGLDFVFRHIRNRELEAARPPTPAAAPTRPTRPPARGTGGSLRRMS